MRLPSYQKASKGDIALAIVSAFVSAANLDIQFDLDALVSVGFHDPVSTAGEGVTSSSPMTKVVVVRPVMPRAVGQGDAAVRRARRPAAAVLAAAEGAERLAHPLAHEREDERHVGGDDGDEGLADGPGRGVLRPGHVVGDDQDAAEDTGHHDEYSSGE